MRYTYTSIDRVFTKVDRDLTTDYNESDIIEWTGDALEAMGSVKSYEEYVVFSEVKNHQCVIPRGTHAIIQIAKNNKWNSLVDSIDCVKNVATECGKAQFDFLSLEDSPNNLRLIPNFDFSLDYKAWRDSKCYCSGFTPVRLTNNVFFNSLVCSDDTPYTGNSEEYNIIMKTMLRFSFLSGQVAIAILKQAMDEHGYPLIPDSFSHLTAIVAYIRFRMSSRDCFNGRQAACGDADKSEGQWQWYCKQAGNIDLMPHGIDEHQNLLDQRSYILPRHNKYFNFFGNLSTPEDRSYLANNGNRMIK